MSFDGTATPSQRELRMRPLHALNFEVRFEQDPIAGAAQAEAPAGEGAFAEISGIEATMQHKEIREGGLNLGAHQRPGPVGYQTVVLKRGLMRNRDLWRWFEAVAGGGYAPRLKVTIEMRGMDGEPLMRWSLRRALPVRFKSADFNARANEVGVEELHLVHEGIEHEEVGS
jgi:phage tail-like protein